MLSGLNTNVPYKGSVFHVQTETGGSKYPFITTFLYHEGAILYSKKTGYAELLGEAGLAEKLYEMMRAQHIGVVRELEEGRVKGAEALGGGAKADAVEETASAGNINELDERVMQYIFSGQGAGK